MSSKQIKEEEKQPSAGVAPGSAADPPAGPTLAEAVPEKTESAEEKTEEIAEAVQEKIENIEKKTEEIAEVAEEVTETIVADINTVDQKEVRASEKDLLKKAEEVEAAKVKLKEAAADHDVLCRQPVGVHRVPGTRRWRHRLGR